MARILLTGVSGQVGHELLKMLTPLAEVIAVTRQDMDLTNQASILQILEKYQPTIIVNPAAYTAVDKAESEQ
ncbi:MAG TPA: sugar nucleotide-binding protein, partial [Agitococcus sp.]|nr:sugar nucleotide-binding protein [Agitococcus sp.]